MGDPLICQLAAVADEHGRIEFRSYGEFKRRIGWTYCGTRKFGRLVSKLYNTRESGVKFMSARLRSQDQGRDVRSHLLVLTPEARVLARLHEGPVSVPPHEPRTEFLDRCFGVHDCESLIARLADREQIQVIRASGSRGKLYETLLLA